MSAYLYGQQKVSITPTDKIARLESQLAKYQKKYDDLRQQSPERWWHDEHFDNQLRVLEAVIANIKEQLMELKKKPRPDVPKKT